MKSEQFVPPLGPGETGPILKRHLVASCGPWVLAKPNKDNGRLIFPEANMDQPIAYVFDSVAENAAFLAHAWEDQKRLLATVLRYKGIFGELVKSIRANSTISEDQDGNQLFFVDISPTLLNHLEEIAKL